MAGWYYPAEIFALTFRMDESLTGFEAILSVQYIAWYGR